MKSVFLTFLLFTLVVSCSTTKQSCFLVGTYTETTSQGINVVTFDSENKNISLQYVITGVENPSFVITNKAKTIVVTVEETASENGGKVTSFSYDLASNKFLKLNSFFTKGNHPCTVAFSPNEKFIIVGNYSGGNVAVFPIDKKGNLSDIVQLINYEGKSENVDRQEKSHVHSAVFHPNKNFLFLADLGRDAIEMIPFDISKGSIQLNSKTFLKIEESVSANVKAGSGPRHLLFSTSGKILYVTYELTNEVSVFSFTNNQLQHLQTILLTNTPTKSGSTAELRLSDDGKFLYASVRGDDNELVVMKVSNNEKLSIIQTIKTALKPRNFILTQDQKTILVATQDANLISVFDRDKKTGLLSPTSSKLSINKPVYMYGL